MYDGAEAPPAAASRDAGGRFGAGNPGRPKGSKNRIGQRLAQAVLADFWIHKDEVLSKLRQTDVVAYARFVSRLLPSATEETLEEPEAETFDHLVAHARLVGKIVNHNNGRSNSIDAVLEAALRDPKKAARLAKLSPGAGALRRFSVDYGRRVLE